MSTADPAGALPSGTEGASLTPIPLVDDRNAARHDRLRAEVWSSRVGSKVLRDAEVGRAQLVGSTSVGGTVRAERLEARGLLEVAGAVIVRDRLEVRGELRAGSTVQGGDVEVHGILRALGAVTADRRCDVTGTLRAPSVTAAELRAEGEIRIPDLVRAPRVDLRPTDRSHVERVEGSTVRIHGKVAGPVEALLGRPLEVTVGRIDGSRVELEAVEVGLVHAEEIVLGRHARVRTIEGKVVSVHRTSHIGPESHSRPPPGLSR